VARVKQHVPILKYVTFFHITVRNVSILRCTMEAERPQYLLTYQLIYFWAAVKGRLTCLLWQYGHCMCNIEVKGTVTFVSVLN